MKVIETEFNGVRFRSRTEARWAVFMACANIKYIYEPEGFDLGESGWYIPDFWLPEIDKFLEIKPSVPLVGRESPTFALADATGKAVITFCGPPSAPDFDRGYREDGHFHSKEGGDNCYWFCRCPECGSAGIEFCGRADRIKCECPKSPHQDKGYNFDDPFLLFAYKEASNAFRFKRRNYE
jgi:hypothetical protein